MIKRVFDIFFSLLGLIILLPVLICIAFLITATSGGGVFYLQTRVGKNGKEFKLFKFRTMKKNADREGLLTVGNRDSRITVAGYYLRKYKLDELPQLINVFVGSMSFVGPRPEVPKYVYLYSSEQRKILDMKPGITDYASIEYFNENELLAKAVDAEETYVKEVMPKKLALNKKYILEAGILTDIKIIFKTLKKIVS